MANGAGLSAESSAISQWRRDRAEHWRLLSGGKPNVIVDAEEGSPTKGYQSVTYDYNKDVKGLFATNLGKDAVVKTFNSARGGGLRPRGEKGGHGYYTDARFDADTNEVVLSGQVRRHGVWGFFDSDKAHEKRYSLQEYNDIIKNTAESEYRSGRVKSQWVGREQQRHAEEAVQEHEAKRASGGAELFSMEVSDGRVMQKNRDTGEWVFVDAAADPEAEPESDTTGASRRISAETYARGVKQIQAKIDAGENNGMNAEEFARLIGEYDLDTEGLDPNNPADTIYLTQAMDKLILASPRAQKMQTMIIGHDGFKTSLERIEDDIMAGFNFNPIFNLHDLRQFPGYGHFDAARKSHNTTAKQLAAAEAKLAKAKAKGGHTGVPLAGVQQTKPGTAPEVLAALQADVDKLIAIKDRQAAGLRDQHPINKLIEKIIIELERAGVLKRLAAHREQQP